jgi:hypothetical protein
LPERNPERTDRITQGTFVVITSVPLPGTKTYKTRHATFIKLTESGRPVGGVLEIRESTATGKTVCNRYALREQDAFSSQEDRAFRLTKPGGDTYYDTYVCGEPPALCPQSERGGPYDSCDCVGFEKWGACKHLTALRALLEAGQLDPNCLPSADL